METQNHIVTTNFDWHQLDCNARHLLVIGARRSALNINVQRTGGHNGLTGVGEHLLDFSLWLRYI